MAKKQYDLEQWLDTRQKVVQAEQTDIVTGEVFQPKSRNHYENLDPVPFAPAVDIPRPTLRQRIENLTQRDPGILGRYVDVQAGDETYEMEVPEDGDTPLTASEQNYIDTIAADLAERAPLPDEGLPRQHSGNSEVPAAGAPPAAAEPPPAAPATPPLTPPGGSVPTR